ncbi:MAG: hypothetical protein NTZ80_02580 [Patescibacteria group bacterium]|nr:hypothetical protein [Patescibacteria group bacterium]
MRKNFNVTYVGAVTLCITFLLTFAIVANSKAQSATSTPKNVKGIILPDPTTTSLKGAGSEITLPKLPSIKPDQATRFYAKTDFDKKFAAISVITQPFMKSLAIPIFILAAIYIGYRMATAVDDETAKKQKNHLLLLLLGIGVITMAQPIVEIFYYGGNPITDADQTPGTSVIWQTKNVLGKIASETSGIINAAAYILSAIAIVIVIINAFFVFFAEGDKDKVKESTRGIIYACIGLLLVGLSHTIVTAIYGSMDTFAAGKANELGMHTSLIISEATGVLNFALSFIGAIAVIMAIYAGYQYLTAGEDEDQAKNAIKIIVSAIIGIIVVMSSYVIINAILQ